MPTWDVVTGTPTLAGTGRGNGFSFGGAYLAIGHSTTPFLTVVDTSDWSVVAGVPAMPGVTHDAEFMPGTAYLAVGHAQGSRLTVIDTSDWTVVAGTPSLPNTCNAVAFSPNGAYLAAAHISDGRLTIIDTSDWSVVPGTPALADTGRGLAFSHDGAYLAVAHQGGDRLTVIDTSDWSVIAGTPAIPGGSTDSSQDVAFTSDSSYLAVVHNISPFLTVIDTSDWSVVSGTPTLSSLAFAVAFRPGDGYLAAGHFGGSFLTIVDTSDWSVVSGTPSLPGQVNGVSFEHGGGYLAAGHFESPFLTVIDSSVEEPVAGDIVALLADSTAEFSGVAAVVGGLESQLEGVAAELAGTVSAIFGDFADTLGSTAALLTSEFVDARHVTMVGGAATDMETSWAYNVHASVGAAAIQQLHYNPQVDDLLAAMASTTALGNFAQEALLSATADIIADTRSLALLWLRAQAAGASELFILRTAELVLEGLSGLVGKQAFSEALTAAATADDELQQVLVTQILDQAAAELSPQFVMQVGVNETLEATAGDETQVHAHLRAAIMEQAGAWVTFKLSDEVVAGWVMNVEGERPLSQYDGFDFNSYARIGDTYWAAGDEGLFALGGGTDAGAPIDAHVTTMMLDFDSTRQKRVVAAYLGYTSGGRVVLKVRAVDDGRLVEHWYEAREDSPEVPQEGYMPLGRGLKSRYWQFTLANENGADFEVDRLELWPIILNRRV